MTLFSEILVVAEHHAGQLARVTFEIVSFARQVASAAGGGEIGGVILGHSLRSLAEEFAARAGLPVLAAEHERLGHYNADAYIRTLTEIISRRAPAFVLIPHTASGWDYAPRLTVAVNASSLAGVSAVLAGQPPSFLRRAAGGRMMLEIAPLPGKTAVVTVMPGAAEPGPATESGRVESWSVPAELLAGLEKRSRTVGYRESPARQLDLTRAEVIVAVGRGLRGPEHLSLLRELAACFDKAALAASRPVVDAGWLPYEHQVGQTGQVVAPRLYLACGISGQIQHTAGMSRSELIAAVNTDPQAAIFALAHLGVCRDLHAFLPVLTEKIRRERQRRGGKGE